MPSQNFVYADVNGHIGYYAPGRIPIRAHGDGASPVDGWTGENEWTGMVPFADLPHVFDPPSHFIVTANNRPAPDGYPHLLGLDWAEPYRAQRIIDLLRERPQLYAGRLRGHPGRYVLAARAGAAAACCCSTCTRATRAIATPSRLLRALEFRRASRQRRRRRCSKPGFFVSRQRSPETISARSSRDLYQSRFTFVTRFLLNTLRSNDSAWCDDVTDASRRRRARTR